MIAHCPDPVKNQFKVQHRVWTRWGNPAKMVFNNLYENIMQNPEFVFPPKMSVEISQKDLKVIAWNAAWLAADACDAA